ncbi:MAG: YggS family pyridoxal phosphate-dependent enzyme [candidate division WOR-3 bacterium]|nr:YggS family pyridoxal phosphate-dependent enzyme [candidate division WOR-3 bacterium]
MGKIGDNYKKLRDSIPPYVTIVVASKMRTPDEVKEVIQAGAEDIGENYVYPEAFDKYQSLGDIAKKARWHFIGHLQKNKINKALFIFDVIQTVESFRKAKEIDKRVKGAGKSIIPVFLEINSGREESKTGFPPDISILKEALVKMEELKHIKIKGLMTMGPRFGDPEEARPYFKLTKELFEQLKDVETKNSELKILSMGMSNSYKVAIEEGANMVRIGSLIYGSQGRSLHCCGFLT